MLKIWCEICEGGTIDSLCPACDCNGYKETPEDGVPRDECSERSDKYGIADAAADAAVLASLEKLCVAASGDKDGAAVIEIAASIINRLHRFYCGAGE